MIKEIHNIVKAGVITVFTILREAIIDFCSPADLDVISRGARKRINHPVDRKIYSGAMDNLREQRYSGVENPTVTITWHDGTQDTIFSISGPTIINNTNRCIIRTYAMLTGSCHWKMRRKK